MKFEFVQCDRVDSTNKHDDIDCKNCIDYYEELKGDAIDEFLYQNMDKQGFPKRDLIDFCEVSNDDGDFDDGRMLKFGFWSNPI